MLRVTSALVTLAGTFTCSVDVRAEVVIETVTVGNPGNAGELSGDCVPDGAGPCRECGAVDYVYNIGKFEVTAGQYTEMLNAVAAMDTYGLYDPGMDIGSVGCQITQNGEAGSYTYDFRGGTVEAPGSTAADWENRPVNYISWGDAARFCNWLHNGQPTGAQDLSTTEDGSYYLNGATTDEQLLAIMREPDATWVIPTEDEWYKAAYHYNNGVTGNYYSYPTGTDAIPNNGYPEGDTGNSANFNDGDTTIGSPYWRTEVGFFGLSDSPYGTFDQAGNVWEWNEAVISLDRGRRGGHLFAYAAHPLNAAWRNYYSPSVDSHYNGFRVAEVPDCNDNGIPDPCDLDCGPTSGPCDVEGCGQSTDTDGDGVPDECDTCPGYDDTADADGDGIADACDVCPGYDDAQPCPIPAVTEWGLIVMTLLLFGAGSVVLAKCRQPSTA